MVAGTKGNCSTSILKRRGNWGHGFVDYGWSRGNLGGGCQLLAREEQQQQGGRWEFNNWLAGWLGLLLGTYLCAIGARSIDPVASILVCEAI